MCHKVRFFTLKIIFLTKKVLKNLKTFRFGTFFVARKIVHTFSQIKGLNNDTNSSFSLIILQKLYFWRLKYASQTKYIFWGNLQFLRWHLYYKNNDENCLIVLIWGQKIYFWSQNYTSQTIYFCLEILQQHPWGSQILFCSSLGFLAGGFWQFKCVLLEN